MEVNLKQILILTKASLEVYRIFAEELKSSLDNPCDWLHFKHSSAIIGISDKVQLIFRSLYPETTRGFQPDSVVVFRYGNIRLTTIDGDTIEYMNEVSKGIGGHGIIDFTSCEKQAINTILNKYSEELNEI